MERSLKQTRPSLHPSGHVYFRSHNRYSDRHHPGRPLDGAGDGGGISQRVSPASRQTVQITGTTSNPDTGKRISRLNPQCEWIVHEVPELQIVANELWDQVKARQDNVKRDTRTDCKSTKPSWTQTRPKYLFSGLMKCGLCGGSFAKISANLFGCATARNKGTCDNRLNIRRSALEGSVLNGRKNQLMDPDLFKEFADEFCREINRLNMDSATKIEQIRSEIITIDRKLRRLVDAITQGANALTLNEERLSLENRKKELEKRLGAHSEPEPLIHPNLAEVYRRKVADLHQTLHSDSAASDAFELIRSLVDKITLTPANGELRIDLRGELASILNLCSESKKPASHVRDGLEQIKMVAGARNQRCLHLDYAAL